MATAEAVERLQGLARELFGDGIPHIEAMGIGLVEIGDGRLLLGQAYRDDLLGNTESGLLAGGVVTTLADTACGLMAILAWPEPRLAATLDLRLDFLRPAEAGRGLMVEAVCVQRTRQVVFTRGTVYQESASRPVAIAAGTFMVTGEPQELPRSAGQVRPQSVP